ncbi:MAG: hypothetical protein N2557_08565, partial [Hydrogenophilus sp.]|nr:hypothetical protein [Hydrogenophilus sp.]
MGQISSEDLRGAFKAISEFKHSSRPTTGYGVESLRYGVREELASAIAALIWAVLREEAFKDCIEDYLLLAYEGLVKAETLWNYIVRERLLSQEGRIFYNDAAERLGLKGLGEQIGEEQEAAALVGMLLD